ncbi:MAG: carboxypeptidase regulatory-like domain-containing protein [Sandaracinaceae bacterium]
MVATWVAPLLSASLLGACSEDPHPTTPTDRGDPAPDVASDPSPPSAEYTVIEDPAELERVGALAGAVRWAGERPEVARFTVDTHAEACGEQRESEALRISSRGGVAGTVVELVDVRRGRALDVPAEAPLLAHERCRFVPHLVSVTLGQPLRLANRDPVIHNVHATLDGRTAIDVGLPEQGSQVARSLSTPGIYRVVDDAGHGWEQAWIVATAHPYVAISDEDGRFRIEGVPPASYTVRVWHEGWRVLGEASGRPRYSAPVILTRQISVAPRQETTVDFELSQALGELAGD